MSLPVWSGELKNRSSRDIKLWTLTATCMTVACLWSLVALSAANAASATPVAAEKGMVVSAQHLATKIGVNILKRSGSAIDEA